MTQRDADWLTFKEHEVAIRRESRHYNGRSNESIVSEVGAQWSAILNQTDYAYCIRDVENTLDTARYYEVEVGYAEDSNAALTNAQRPWPQTDARLVLMATYHWKIHYFALQRFLAEQSLLRNSGKRNASERSRDWTKGEIRRALRVMRILDRVKNVANGLVPVPAAPVAAPALIPGTVNAGDGGAGAGEDEEAEQEERERVVDGVVKQEQTVHGEKNVEEEEQREGEQEQGEQEQDNEENPVADQPKDPQVLVAEDNASNRKKSDSRQNHTGRSKRGAEAADDSQLPLRKSPRRPASKAAGQIRQESIPQEQIDPKTEFDAKWSSILRKRQSDTDVDGHEWFKLHYEVEKIAEENLGYLIPDGSSDEAQARMRLRVNSKLEPILDRAWKTYISLVNHNHNGAYGPDDYEAAVQNRKDALSALREGNSPEWPPEDSDLREPPSDPEREGLDIPAGDEDDEDDEDDSEHRVRSPSETAREIGFDGIAAGIPGNWQFSSGFGRGGHGAASLWLNLRIDQQQNLVERLVVKDVYLGTTWKLSYLWIDHDRLREPAIHDQLSRAGSKHGIVRYRGTVRRPERRLLRLYMEYCPHGDLSQLLCRHAKYNPAQKDEERGDDDEPIPPVPIPSRALWAIFEALAEAACILAYGRVPSEDGANAVPAWDTIIHRDLKPANIFLAAPLTTNGRGIPVFKMGDFGLAVHHNFGKLRNPEGMRGVGTAGWKAPELQRYDEDDETVPHHKLSSATDIWAIGRIMLALIELTPGTANRRLQNIWYGRAYDGAVPHSPKRPQLEARYGSRMYRSFDKCLEAQPDDRITAHKLRRDIKKHLDRTYSREGGERPPLQLEEGDVLEYSPDDISLKWAS